jgi:hypothetical protein
MPTIDVKKEQRGVMATATAAREFSDAEKKRLLHRRHAQRRDVRGLPVTYQPNAASFFTH